MQHGIEQGFEGGHRGPQGGIAAGLERLGRSAGATAAGPAAGHGAAFLLSRAGNAAGLNSGEIQVLTYLAHFVTRRRAAAGQYLVQCKNEWLAFDCGRSIRQVQNILRGLELKGWLVRLAGKYNNRAGRGLAAGGMDLAPLFRDRMAELERLMQAAFAGRRRRHELTPAEAGLETGLETGLEGGRGVDLSDLEPVPDFAEAGAAGRAADDRLSRRKIAYRGEMNFAPNTDLQPQKDSYRDCSQATPEGALSGDVVPPGCMAGPAVDAASDKRPEKQDGGRKQGGGYWQPRAATAAPASAAAFCDALTALEPDLADHLGARGDLKTLFSVAWYFAQALGLPRHVYDAGIAAHGAAYVAPAVFLTAAKKRRGECRNAVGYLRSLLEAERPHDLWRSIHALRRAMAQ